MRRGLDRFEDMLEAIEAIARHLSGGREAFDRDELLRVWFLRHLEVIGEAASRVGEGLRMRHAELLDGLRFYSSLPSSLIPPRDPLSLLMQ